jgi:hypothetical protein
MDACVDENISVDGGTETRGISELTELHEISVSLLPDDIRSLTVRSADSLPRDRVRSCRMNSCVSSPTTSTTTTYTDPSECSALPLAHSTKTSHGDSTKPWSATVDGGWTGNSRMGG